MTLCKRTWPNHVKNRKLHRGRLFWQLQASFKGQDLKVFFLGEEGEMISHIGAVNIECFEPSSMSFLIFYTLILLLTTVLNTSLASTVVQVSCQVSITVGLIGLSCYGGSPTLIKTEPLTMIMYFAGHNTSKIFKIWQKMMFCYGLWLVHTACN